MPTSRKRVVSVDRQAAKQVIAETGRKAMAAASRKANAGRQTAKRRLKSTAGSAARTIIGRAADARRQVGNAIEKRKSAAIRGALKACIELSGKQLAALEKLESSLAKH